MAVGDNYRGDNDGDGGGVVGGDDHDGGDFAAAFGDGDDDNNVCEVSKLLMIVGLTSISPYLNCVDMFTSLELSDVVKM